MSSHLTQPISSINEGRGILIFHHLEMGWNPNHPCFDTICQKGEKIDTMGIDSPHVSANQTFGNKGRLFVCGMKPFQNGNGSLFQAAPALIFIRLLITPQ